MLEEEEFPPVLLEEVVADGLEVELPEVDVVVVVDLGDECSESFLADAL